MGVGVITDSRCGGGVAAASVGVGRGVVVGRGVGSATVGATVGVPCGAALHALNRIPLSNAPHARFTNGLNTRALY